MGWQTLRYGAVCCTVAAGCVTAAQPHNQRGVALFNAGQYEVAQAEFLQAANADPTNADAFYNLGSTHHRLGRLADAEWNYGRCLELDPDHSKCRHAHAVLLLEQDRAEQAYAAAERWVASSPGRPDPLVELAWLEKESGEPEGARRLLEQAIALEPRHSRALAELASLYEASHEPDRALALYERALRSNPSEPELARRVADLRGLAPSHAAADGSLSTRLVDRPGPPRVARDLRYDLRQ